MIKIIGALLFLIITAVFTHAATTGTLFTIPAGQTGYASIEIEANRLMDSYSITLKRVNGGEVAGVNLLRANPMFDTSWNQYPWGDYNTQVSVDHYDNSDKPEVFWTLNVYDLPPGEYYVQYGGQGFVSSPYPLNTYQGLLDFMVWYFEYDFFMLPPMGDYGYWVHDASSLMIIRLMGSSH